MKFLKTSGRISFLTGIAGWIIFAVIRHQGNDQIGYYLLVFPCLVTLGILLLAIRNFLVALRQKKDTGTIVFASFFLFGSAVLTLVTGILISVLIYFPKSAAFIEFQKVIEQDAGAIEKFGRINYYGLFPEGKYGTHVADFHVYVYGEKRQSRVYFKAHSEKEGWVIDVFNY